MYKKFSPLLAAAFLVALIFPIPAKAGSGYLAVKNSKYFHVVGDCWFLEGISPSDMVWYATQQEALRSGRMTCQRCAQGDLSAYDDVENKYKKRTGEEIRELLSINKTNEISEYKNGEKLYFSILGQATFHEEGCRLIRNPSKSVTVWYGSFEEAQNTGKNYCHACKTRYDLPKNTQGISASNNQNKDIPQRAYSNEENDEISPLFFVLLLGSFVYVFYKFVTKILFNVTLDAPNAVETKPQNNASPSNISAEAEYKKGNVSYPVTQSNKISETPVSKPTPISQSRKTQMELEAWIRKRKSNEEIGREYERYIGYLCEIRGLKVKYNGATKGRSDKGRDLIVIKGNTYYVVQCKYWGKEKVIHENHINQVHGTTDWMARKDKAHTYVAVLVTNISISDDAKDCARTVEVLVYEGLPMKGLTERPLIKCNLSKERKRIYHLPFDKTYDAVELGGRKGCFYAWTVEEAESAGFRRAFYPDW